MTDKPLRGALIGCGFFARNHLRAWAGIPGVELVAVCDIDPAKARAAAERHGVACVHADAAAMLAAERPDFVDVATTSASHRALVELAAAHGAAVICQKPFAETMEDAQAMVDACARAGVPLMVHENFRWQKPFRVMGDMADAGTPGRINFARFSFRHGYDNYRNQPYLAEIERFAIMDVGLHVYDLARRFLGEVDSLFCRAQRLNPRVRGEDSFHATLRHASGAVSVCDVSFWSRLRPEPFPEALAVIEGDDATLELRQGYRLIVHRDGGAEEIDVAPEPPAWAERPWHAVQESVAATQAHFVEALRAGTEPRPSGADNLRTLALALASYDSAAQERVVRVDGTRWS